MSGRRFRRSAAAAAALAVLGGFGAGPAYADAGADGVRWSPLGIAASGDCPANAPNVKAVPWALQRVLLDQFWQDGAATGEGVVVAVIDTGVDDTNPQLASKVIEGPSLLKDKDKKPVEGGSKVDPVGHGTKVAGIIAASRTDATGFVGLAPKAQILAIRQNDAEGNGDVRTLAEAIRESIARGAKIINISQDVRGAGGPNFDGADQLKAAVDLAEAKGVLIVASTGNDGKEGNTYPAAYETVLAVGASDRNNERAVFSQYGDFVDVAAPGVDMLSTVPRSGQCVDNGTSFAAPYVAGLAAVLLSAHKDWTPAQLRARIEQTAQRTQRDRNIWIGWGVVDPLKAVTNAPASPPSTAAPDAPVQLAGAHVVPRPLGLEETQADRDQRTATYVLGLAALAVALLVGGTVVLRDLRRRRAAG
ncbi:type VII secretion-associated serine protease mycosin [Kitasatospora sp. NPDC054939]